MLQCLKAFLPEVNIFVNSSNAITITSGVPQGGCSLANFVSAVHK